MAIRTIKEQKKMKQNEKEKFAVLMTGMASNFRDPLTKDDLDFRWMILKDYLYRDIERAAIRLIKTNKYPKMPPVGAIIQLIEGNPEDKIAFAWSDIMRQISAVGYVGKPTFKDPVLTQLFEEGRLSWLDLCDKTTKDLDYYGKQVFPGLYRGIKINMEKKTKRLEGSYDTPVKFIV